MSKESRFPEYRKCVALMRKHDPQLQEDGFHLLLPHAASHVDELMADFQKETELALRRWFLELIGAARSPRAFNLLVEQLQSSDDSLRGWAARGLRELNTPEARQALFDAGVQNAPRDWVRGA